MRRLQVNNLPPGDLKPRANNPRTHSKKQIGQLADSISQFGFTNPILVDADRRIIAGHGRLEAAKLLGLERVPVICIDDMTEAEIRAHVIADNKLAQNAGWDPDLLALKLKELSEIDLGFELSLTGFEIPEIDLLIQGLDHSPPDAADEIPKTDPDPRSAAPAIYGYWDATGSSAAMPPGKKPLPS